LRYESISLSSTSKLRHFIAVFTSFCLALNEFIKETGILLQYRRLSMCDEVVRYYEDAAGVLQGFIRLSVASK
jgi:hypothetical protein